MTLVEHARKTESLDTHYGEKLPKQSKTINLHRFRVRPGLAQRLLWPRITRVWMLVQSGHIRVRFGSKESKL